MQHNNAPAPPDMRRQITNTLASLARGQSRSSSGGRRSRSNISGTQRNAELSDALNRAQRNL